MSRTRNRQRFPGCNWVHNPSSGGYLMSSSNLLTNRSQHCWRRKGVYELGLTIIDSNLDKFSNQVPFHDRIYIFHAAPARHEFRPLLRMALDRELSSTYSSESRFIRRVVAIDLCRSPDTLSWSSVSPLGFASLLPFKALCHYNCFGQRIVSGNKALTTEVIFKSSQFGGISFGSG